MLDIAGEKDGVEEGRNECLIDAFVQHNQDPFFGNVKSKGAWVLGL